MYIVPYFKVPQNYLQSVLYYYDLCTKICILIYMYVSKRPNEKVEREQSFLRWWKRSHNELEHSKGKHILLMHNNSLRNWMRHIQL